MVATDMISCAIIACQRRDRRRSDPYYDRRLLFEVDELIAHMWPIDAAQIYWPTRGTRAVMFARHVAMYLAVVEGGLSHSACARLFERDRRVIAYAIARIEQRRDDDATFDATLDHLADRLHQSLAQPNASKTDAPSIRN